MLAGVLLGLPLALGAALVWLAPEPAMAARASLWIIIYGAVMVAILGGIRAGAGLGPYTARHTMRGFAIAGLSFLAAVTILLLPPMPAICLLIASIMVQAVSDMTILQRRALPSWYGQFRLSLVALSITSLLVVLVRLVIVA